MYLCYKDISIIIGKWSLRACQENCVNGYVRISRLEPVCQIVWQIDLLLKPNF